MEVKERIIALRILKKMKEYPEYSHYIDVKVKYIGKNDDKKTKIPE